LFLAHTKTCTISTSYFLQTNFKIISADYPKNLHYAHFFPGKAASKNDKSCLAAFFLGAGAAAMVLALLCDADDDDDDVLLVVDATGTVGSNCPGKH
jgi:hypothetical protein